MIERALTILILLIAVSGYGLCIYMVNDYNKTLTAMLRFNVENSAEVKAADMAAPLVARKPKVGG